jgi:hypothetical protein
MYLFILLQIEEFQQLDKFEIANQINDSFLEPLQRFQALNSYHL